MKNINIRPIKPGEIPLLEELLYQALFQRDLSCPLPKSIIYDPSIIIYMEDFGKPDDLCLVAEFEERPVGAVWTRILPGPVKGFGNVDDKTPEFAISLMPDFRGKGIGIQLMQEMIAYLRKKGYKQASLAVQKDNDAVRLYKKAGFQIIDTTEEEYIMVIQLN